MDAAKAAVHRFTGRKGHTTEVEEVVNPAVVNETVKPQRHEELTTAVDREVHQHHYHTTVQPIAHQEVLPEKHVHNIVPVENREFHHENPDEVKGRVSAELGRFQNTSTVHETKHTQSAAPTVTGEHVHHHVHETVQPIIHKETIQPEVIHTTVPIHEVHHATSTHHGLSALPMKSLDEFKKMGGLLSGGSSTTHESYDGPPREYNKDLSTTFEKLGLHGGHHTDHTGQTGHHTGHTGTTGTTGLTGTGRNTTGTTDTTGTSGLTGTRDATGASGLTGSDHRHGTGLTGTTGSTGLTGSDHRHGTGLTGTTGSGGLTGSDHRQGTGLTGTTGSSGLTGSDHRHGTDLPGTTGTAGKSGLMGTSGHRTHDSAIGMDSPTGKHTSSGLTGTDTNTTTNTTTSSTSTGGVRHSSNLLNKLDPRVDADGDGKRGIAN